MEFAPDEVTTLAYPERQLIVVDSDDAVEVLRMAEAQAASGDKPLSWAPAQWGAMAGMAGMAFGAAIIAGQELYKARRRANRVHLPYLVVTASQAERLTFPHGHHRRGVVYVGDPGVAGSYYPIASFHRFLFEAKVAEAIRLLRTLGATEISIEYLEGFDRGAGVNLSVAIPAGPGVEASGGINGKKGTHFAARTTMHLSPTAPASIPQDLTWFRSEPLWREVANARLENGLRSFTLDLTYTDDFGIDANLSSKIKKVGLDLGGDFTKYRKTEWKLSGEFAE